MRQFPQLVEKIENLEFQNIFINEGDELSAVLQITAGAGGTRLRLGFYTHENVSNVEQKNKAIKSIIIELELSRRRCSWCKTVT